MNIVLIGMRGSGKTTAGKLLAEKLGKQYIEMDELIIRKAGLSIPDIVKQYGWGKFRDVEEEVCREVARLDNAVIATGGGVITREQNISNLKKNGKLIYLTASLDTLLGRIGNDPSRPSLTGKSPREDLETVLGERSPVYQRAADFTIDTEGKTPAEVAREIAGLLIEPEVRVNAGTPVCCLIGHPVGHSLSPLIHNTAYKALGLNFFYTAFDVTDVRLAIGGIRGLGIRGASVTIPHKITAMEYLDEVDEAAREIGAINTIVNRDGKLLGFNTDYGAALKALEEKTSLKGKKAVLVGAGGVALAIAIGLKKKGAEVIILDIVVERAAELAKRVGARSSGLDKLTEIAPADILVNATPVGMWPRTDETAIPGELLHPGLTVFDVVYNPRETRLLAEAKEKGCAVVYGYKMFLYQAVEQFELFTGHKAPLAVMENILIKALEGGGNAPVTDRG